MPNSAHRARQREASDLSRHPQALGRVDASRGEATRETLPIIKASARKAWTEDRLRSICVRPRCIMSVVREAVLSSILVSLMILAFLGSWRSVIVVCTQSRWPSSRPSSV